MKTLIQSIFISMILTTKVSTAQNSFPVNFEFEDGTTILQWNTVKEINSSYFIVETSVDSLNFSIIGRIKAAGYSQTNQHYTLECSKREILKQYIRITLVSMDGLRESTLVLNEVKKDYQELLAEK